MYHRWKDVKTAFIFSCMKNSYESETETQEWPYHQVSPLRSCNPKFPAGSCSIKTLTDSRLQIPIEKIPWITFYLLHFRPVVLPFLLCGTAILRKGFEVLLNVELKIFHSTLLLPYCIHQLMKYNSHLNILLFGVITLNEWNGWKILSIATPGTSTQIFDQYTKVCLLWHEPEDKETAYYSGKVL